MHVQEDFDNNDKVIVQKYIQKEYHHSPNTIREIFIDKAKKLHCGST